MNGSLGKECAWFIFWVRSYEKVRIWFTRDIGVGPDRKRDENRQDFPCIIYSTYENKPPENLQ